MMEKILKLSLLVLTIAVIPYLYFFVRDVRAVSGTAVEKNVGGCYPQELLTTADRFSVRVEWRTDDDCISYVKFGLNSNLEQNGQVVFSEDGLVLKQEHVVEVDSLKPGTQYSFGIVSRDEIFGEDGQIMTFRTLD